MVHTRESNDEKLPTGEATVTKDAGMHLSSGCHSSYIIADEGPGLCRNLVSSEEIETRLAKE